MLKKLKNIFYKKESYYIYLPSYSLEGSRMIGSILLVDSKFIDCITQGHKTVKDLELEYKKDIGLVVKEITIDFINKNLINKEVREEIESLLSVDKIEKINKSSKLFPLLKEEYWTFNMVEKRVEIYKDYFLFKGETINGDSFFSMEITLNDIL